MSLENRSSSSTSGTCNARSEEHTSELQSHLNLVCRLLLEKKKQISIVHSCGFFRRRLLIVCHRVRWDMFRLSATQLRMTTFVRTAIQWSHMVYYSLIDRCR